MKVVRRVVKLVTNAEARAITGRSILWGDTVECDYEEMARALEAFNLTPFEICNAINIRPKSLACLQTIIEEMADRLSREQMDKILKIVE